MKITYLKKLQKSKRAYEKRTDGVEKQTSGRTPTPIDPEAKPQIPKPRGRPRGFKNKIEQ